MPRRRLVFMLATIGALTMPYCGAHALGIVVTSPADDGEGTLREAITLANSADEEVSILFDVKLEEIALTSPLPILTNATHRIQIDGGGTTVLDGAALVSGHGLSAVGAQVEIRGLTVVGFPESGIALSGADGSIVTGCLIGLDTGGARGNTSGISIAASSGIQIGGSDAADRNVISGNSGVGIEIQANVSGLQVRGNYIGTNLDGMTTLGNNLGIFFGGGAGDGIIGGSGAGEGNVISGNAVYGISLSGSEADFVFKGNLIGLNADGTAALPNESAGILISIGSSITIGGDQPGEGNTISGNGMQGILLAGSSNIHLLGNTVGLALDGATPVPNATGIEINNCDNIQLGNLDSGGGNTVSGNTGAGIQLAGNSTNIGIRDNAIGTDESRTLLRGNGGAGVLCVSATDVFVGRNSERFGNVIAGNNIGVHVLDGDDVSMRENSIYANTSGGIVLAEGVNDDIEAPLINGLGSVHGIAQPLQLVEIFVDDDNQGRIFLDAVLASEDSGDFFSPVNLGAYEGKYVTVTATDLNGGTSEFSSPRLVEDVAPEFHTADQDNDQVITLSELLRVIQFYNSTGLSCVVPPVTSEDGYLPVPGFQGCGPHSSDYNPTDWKIGLSELLRLIQFFNSAGYEACVAGEDGFCPLVS